MRRRVADRSWSDRRADIDHRRLLKWGLVVLFVLTLVLLAIPDDVRAPNHGEATVIVDEQTLALAPESDGYVEASHTFDLPDDVTSFEVRLPTGASVREERGFSQVDDRRYRWDGEEAAPSITYLAAVDRRIDRDGPIAGPGDYLFKDAGEWALIGIPRPSYGWGWTGDGALSINRQTDVDGPGAASERIAFLGEHDEYTHEAHGQTFVLIEPARAELAEDPEEIFASLSHASDALRVGDRDEMVFMVAAPTDEIRWGVRGLQTGSADMWVRDRERLDDPDNVWLHEYVHTRQDYATDPSARWFTEASASYYAALLTYEQDRIDFETLQTWLDRGDHARYDGVQLVDPVTWRDEADYVLGALVNAELDRQLRRGSDSEAALTNVFQRFNEHQDVVEHADVLDFFEEAGTPAIAAAGDEYLRGTARPSVWDRESHEAAFGEQPPRFATRIEEVRVTSAYRDRQLQTVGRPVLVPEEAVTLVVRVENRGDVTGSYDIPFRVGDAIVERYDDRLAPGDEDTIEVTYRTSSVGDTTLTVGEATQPITVRPPAHPNVEEFTVAPTSVDRGGAVTVEATVVNAETYPGQTTVGFTRDSRVVVEQLATLDGNESTTVSATIRMPHSGTVPIGIADSGHQPIHVTVERLHAVPVLVAVTVASAVATLALVGAGYLIVRRRYSRRPAR